MEKFLASEEAKNQLHDKDRKLLEASKSWGKMREVLADTANATTLLTALKAFVVNHGENIAQWVKSMVVNLLQ